MTHTVRTTLRPDQELDVGDAEYTDLSRLGLLVTNSPAAPVPATKKAAPPAMTKEG